VGDCGGISRAEGIGGDEGFVSPLPWATRWGKKALALSCPRRCFIVHSYTGEDSVGDARLITVLPGEQTTAPGRQQTLRLICRSQTSDSVRAMALA